MVKKKIKTKKKKKKSRNYRSRPKLFGHFENYSKARDKVPFNTQSTNVSNESIRCAFIKRDIRIVN